MTDLPGVSGEKIGVTTVMDQCSILELVLDQEQFLCCLDFLDFFKGNKWSMSFDRRQSLQSSAPELFTPSIRKL